uniref:Uncharacterized protein n=1 Tax=Arundo donax TaxID=35708 RepID=A0A0A9HAX5_ARUDO
MKLQLHKKRKTTKLFKE